MAQPPQAAQYPDSPPPPPPSPAAENDDQEMTLYYDIQIPCADVTFQIAGDAESARIFGYKSQIIGLSHFLEPVIGKVLSSLTGSRDAKKSVLHNMDMLWRYKIFREAMMLTGRTTTKNVALKLHEKYELALKPGTIDQVAETARLIISNATKSPRLTGLSVMAITIALLAGAWFLSPLKGEVLSAINTPLITQISDILFAALLVILSGPISQTISIALLKSRMKNVLPLKHLKPLIRSLRKFSFVPGLIALAICGGFYVFANFV